MIGYIVVTLYVVATIACFITAIWTGDLRWLGTGIILVMLFVLPTLLANATKDKE